MYYFLDADRRKARGGSLYLEFQPGPYRNAHWQADSLYLPAPLFDDLGLYDLFCKAIPISTTTIIQRLSLTSSSFWLSWRRNTILSAPPKFWQSLSPTQKNGWHSTAALPSAVFKEVSHVPF